MIRQINLSKRDLILTIDLFFFQLIRIKDVGMAEICTALELSFFLILKCFFHYDVYNRKNNASIKGEQFPTEEFG